MRMRLILELIAAALLSATFTAHAGEKTYQEGTSIGHIVVRHSPALQQLSAEYAVCGKKKWQGCNFNPLWDRKQSAIATDWPRVFDYLISLKNWGVHTEAEAEFRYALERYGAENLRNNCTPIVGFWKRRSEYLYRPSFDGFQCKKQSAAREQSRAVSFRVIDFLNKCDIIVEGGSNETHTSGFNFLVLGECRAR